MTTEPSTALATVGPDTPTRTVSVLPYAYWDMRERWGYARSLAHAGDMIPSGLRGNDVDATAARVFLVLETGAMLGLHPMAALQGIDVIKGTAAISPQIFTGLARGAGMKLRIKEVGTIETGDFAIEVALIRPDDDEPVEARFSLKDALRAGLISKYEPKTAGGEFVVESGSDNWRKYPQDMCQWRALGRLARRGAADVTAGIGYFPEELEVAVNEDGVRRDLTSQEDELIAQFKEYDDKADMARVWGEQHPKTAAYPKGEPSELWTERVAAEFSAHLMTLSKDSRPGAVAADPATGEVDEPPSSDPTDYDDAESDGQGGVRSATMDRLQREHAERVVATVTVAAHTVDDHPPASSDEGKNVEAEPVHAPTHTAEEHQPKHDEDPSAGARRLEALDNEDAEYQLQLDAEAADAAAAAEYAREHPEPKKAPDLSALANPDLV